MSTIKKNTKNTIQTILRKKAKQERITCLTAYDAFMASLLDTAGIDMILVGDSASNVIHGHQTTIPITMETMITHASAVVRGTNQALVIGDMPFLSFQPSVETAITNAGRYMKEAGVEAVKMEGGLEMLDTIQRVIECGIPVMGHIGLTPQSIHRFGGPKVQGKQDRSVQYLKESALALEEVGCFSIVLELMKAEVAAEITASLKRTATIGIGAGVGCDGQVLVSNDMLGLRDDSFRPKFLREYANLKPIIAEAVSKYIDDVKTGKYPGDDESF